MTDTTTQTLDWLIWTVDGEPYAGTVADYAKSLEVGHYSGLDVSTSVWIWVDGRPAETEARIVASSYDSDDWARVWVTVNGHDASYKLDGRA